MTAAFFLPDGDGFVGTAHTGGPWDPTRSMHFGPPAALLGRALEDVPSDAVMRVGRITFEILRPVPIGAVRVEARVVRPGRRVQLVEAVLRDGDDRELALARAWRLRMGEVVDLPDSAAPPAAPAGPETGSQRPFFDVGVDVHYGTSVELSFLSGGFLDAGPAMVWMRPTVPLVAGEAISPLQRVLVVADSGNGVSATASPQELTFVNTDLSVHLVREPVGEWVCLEARTMIDGAGIGQADTALSDIRGRIGRSVQTLFVDRPPQADAGLFRRPSSSAESLRSATRVGDRSGGW